MGRVKRFLFTRKALFRLVSKESKILDFGTISVLGRSVEFQNLKPLSDQAGIENVPIEDIIDIVDGYVGKGYADSWPELRQLSLDVAENTGIFIDRVYTAKAILGEYGSNNNGLVTGIIGPVI